MKLKVKYFGMLAEKTGSKEEEFAFEGSTVKELIDHLNTIYPELKNMDFKVAVNQSIAQPDSELGEEIALLPPFSGG